MAKDRDERDEHNAVLLDSDLFFVVKIADTLKHLGYATHTVRTARDFAQALATQPPRVALVNTAARGVDFTQALAAAREAGVPTIAYGAHVDLATQQQAREAGATVVVANSRLAADLPAIVARALRRGADASETSADDGATSPARLPIPDQKPNDQ